MERVLENEEWLRDVDAGVWGFKAEGLGRGRGRMGSAGGWRRLEGGRGGRREGEGGEGGVVYGGAVDVRSTPAVQAANRQEKVDRPDCNSSNLSISPGYVLWPAP